MCSRNCKATDGVVVSGTAPMDKLEGRNYGSSQHTLRSGRTKRKESWSHLGPRKSNGECREGSNLPQDPARSLIGVGVACAGNAEKMCERGKK